MGKACAVYHGRNTCVNFYTVRLALAYFSQMCYDNTNLSTAAVYAEHQGCCGIKIDGRERDALDIWAVRE